MTLTYFKFPTYIFLFCVLTLWGCNLPNHKTQSTDYQIVAPFKNVSIKPQTHTIDPTKAQVVRFASGTTLEVPANAFVDASGKVVKTPVKLSLETYNSPAAILASGIPMTFDENGKQQHFESAGMFQLTGQSEGRKIEIAKDKQLLVNHPSQTADKDFDFFYFEEENQAPAVAQAQVVGRSKKVAKPRKGRWKKLTNHQRDTTAPITKGVDEFSLKFDTKKYPALADLEKIKWQLALNHQNPQNKANNWVLKHTWSSLELNKPKIILGKTVKNIAIKKTSVYDYTFFDVIQNGNKMIVGYDDRVDILNHHAELIVTISDVHLFYGQLPIIDDKYLVVRKKGVPYLYDLKGQEIGHYEDALGLLQVAIKQNRVVFEASSLDSKLVPEYKYVRITDLKGKNIKLIKLKDDIHTTQNGPSVYTSFMLTQNNYLVTNSPEGIQVYNLNGELIRHKKGKYSSIQPWGTNEIITQHLHSKTKLAWDFTTGKARALTDAEQAQQNKTTMDTIASSYPKHSEKLQRRIVYENGQFQLLDWNKQLIMNFNSYDSKIIAAGFIHDAQIYTVSKDGMFRVWSPDGNILTSKQWQDDHIKHVQEWAKPLLLLKAYNPDLRSYKTYNENGDLWCYLGKTNAVYIKYNSLVVIQQPNSIQFMSLIPRPKQAYQLTLHSLNKEFITYVYLDQATEKLIRKQMPLLKQIIKNLGDEHKQEVKRRQREISKTNEHTSKLVKAFSVKKFGIYNCDRPYLIKEPVIFAASLDFGKSVDIHITPMFLITEASGPVLIRYSSYMLKEFKIDPKAPSQIVAILPNNKLAIFSRERMAQIDWGKVKQDKKFTFKMKIIENSVENLEALTKALQ